MPFDLPEQYLIAAERQLGCRFPEAYRGAMLASNGGELEAAGESWILYPIADGSDRKRLARACNHVIRETKVYRERSSFPKEAVAIGDNGSGDILMLLRAGDRLLTSVHVWRHETGKVDKVAEDFEDLL